MLLNSDLGIYVVLWSKAWMFVSCSVVNSAASVRLVRGGPSPRRAGTSEVGTLGCSLVTLVSCLRQDAPGTDHGVLQPLRTPAAAAPDPFRTDCLRQPPPDAHAAPLPSVRRPLLRGSYPPSLRWAGGHGPAPPGPPAAAAAGPSRCRLFALPLPDARPAWSRGKEAGGCAATRERRPERPPRCHSNG